MSERDKLDFHPLEVNLVGVQLAQLALGVLGVLVITGEYSTGMIRASFTAVPKRLPVLWAKAGVFGAATFALMFPAVLIAFFVGQAILARHHIDIGFTGPHVIRVLVGAALYLTVVGLFGLGLGAIVRNTAGGIAAFAAIMFVLPPLMNVLPTSWNSAASPYLPLQAGEAILSTTPGGHLSPWLGLLLFAGYAAAAIAVAARAARPSRHLSPGKRVPVRGPRAPRRLEPGRRVRLPRVGRLLLDARAEARRELRHGVAHTASRPTREPAMKITHGAVACADEDVLGPGGAVEEVPLPQEPLLPFDEQRARPGQHEERLLLRLGVVEPVRLARLQHVEADADLREPGRLALEGALRPGRLPLAVLRRQPLGIPHVDDEPAVARGREAGAGVVERRLRNHRGMLPCFRFGRSSAFVNAVSSASINTGRVRRGSITSST